jgi:hypothetical protein
MYTTDIRVIKAVTNVKIFKAIVDITVSKAIRDTGHHVMRTFMDPWGINVIKLIRCGEVDVRRAGFQKQI